MLPISSSVKAVHFSKLINLSISYPRGLERFTDEMPTFEEVLSLLTHTYWLYWSVFKAINVWKLSVKEEWIIFLVSLYSGFSPRQQSPCICGLQILATLCPCLRLLHQYKRNMIDEHLHTAIMVFFFSGHYRKADFVNTSSSGCCLKTAAPATELRVSCCCEIQRGLIQNEYTRIQKEFKLLSLIFSESIQIFRLKDRYLFNHGQTSLFGTQH